MRKGQPSVGWPFCIHRARRVIEYVGERQPLKLKMSLLHPLTLPYDPAAKTQPFARSNGPRAAEAPRHSHELIGPCWPFPCRMAYLTSGFFPYRSTMLAPRSIRMQSLAFAVAAISILGCSRRAGADTDSATTTLITVKPQAPRAQMGMMMGDSAMIMLDGFCGAQEGDSAMGARVDLIVNGEAAQRASQVTVNVVPAAAGDLAANLVAGKDAHAMCGGHASRIYIGGTTMFLGNPTLTLSSAVPVTITARSTLSAMLGTPLQVKPGEKGAVLKWGAAPAATP